MMGGYWPLFVNDKDGEFVVHEPKVYLHDKLVLFDLL